MVAVVPVGAPAAAPRQRTPEPPRAALQRAEDDLLRHAGLLASGGRSAAAAPDDGDPGGGDSCPPALWKRSAAVAAVRAASWVVRYPVHTATMRAQLTGLVAPIKWTWRSAPVGVWYQWSGDHKLAVVECAVYAVLSEPATLRGVVASMALQYLGFGLLYGLTRQAVVARLTDARAGVVELLRPALRWSWDRALLRGPRGAVLCVCLRDVVSGIAQGLLAPCFARLLTAWSTRARLPGADDALLQHPRPAAREPLLYAHAVGSLLARIAMGAVLYPVDATIVRLMADEAGLTAHAYRGFFDCLLRAPAPLYAGFARALVADLALGWLAAEAVHVLCTFMRRLS
ncbi:hypothetical protein LPJ61_002482 [Coemansia biformis]|uniref:Uncharacterized protein n=1 Tax=Coemansia biformis TaxID=1286918 RepID=A0A9W8CWE5_9FUNG|nr:hypothetical protein LPJ61_002482 [Coemansia biformis]